MTDWSPIAEENPIQGDPWRLGELASHLSDRAQTIRDVITGLGRLDAGEGQMRSTAVDALVEQRGELIPRLGMLEARYDTAAGALRSYCPVLEQAQEMAATAQRDSWAAEREIEIAQRELEAAAAAPVPVPGAPLVPPSAGPTPEEALRLARQRPPRRALPLPGRRQSEPGSCGARSAKPGLSPVAPG